MKIVDPNFVTFPGCVLPTFWAKYFCRMPAGMPDQIHIWQVMAVCTKIQLQLQGVGHFDPQCFINVQKAQL